MNYVDFEDARVPDVMRALNGCALTYRAGNSLDKADGPECSGYSSVATGASDKAVTVLAAPALKGRHQLGVSE
jgi:hypothetical protein